MKRKRGRPSTFSKAVGTYLQRKLKTIEIEEKTLEVLEKCKLKGESFDALIKRLIVERYQAVKKVRELEEKLRSINNDRSIY